MREEKLITVIIPIYNVEAYLPRCMESILAQTYRNLEIILVDDGTKDRSGIIADEYAAKDHRIKVIHKENGGLSSARNAALDVVTGDYIGFVDSDDYIHPKMYEKLLNAVIDNDCEIATCNHYVEKNNKIVIEAPLLDEVVVYDRREALEKILEDKTIRNYAWDKLYKAEFFRNVRFPEGINYEDIPTTFQAFDQADRICHIPDFLYYYQIRDDSISGGADNYKWYRNCQHMTFGKKTRAFYFRDKGDKDLYDRALAESVQINLEMMKWAYHFKERAVIEEQKKHLEWLYSEMKGNPYCLEKYVKLLPIYANPTIYPIYRSLITPLKYATSFLQKVKARFHADYDFGLMPGKEKRFVIFELPCFDNLGDHAIAYAQRNIVEAWAEEAGEAKVFVVDGWDTSRAVLALKKVIGPDDRIFLQGGGNLGDLYDFAQAFRKKVIDAFPHNKIFMFPQTMYFTDTERGKQQLDECKKMFAACDDFTLLARDHKSYGLMKEAFPHNKVYEAPDVVSTLTSDEYDFEKREGILLCIRSDMESNTNADGYKKLLSGCEKITAHVTVSDTCMHEDISAEDREQALRKKWEQFGRHKLVVTDRLHGMIFAMITGTPCIVLGNNHYKVEETYKTFQDCEYLCYVNTIEEACEKMQLMFHNIGVHKYINNRDNYSKLFCEAFLNKES